jgi:hypothetical protein
MTGTLSKPQINIYVYFHGCINKPLITSPSIFAKLAHGTNLKTMLVRFGSMKRMFVPKCCNEV